MVAGDASLAFFRIGSRDKGRGRVRHPSSRATRRNTRPECQGSQCAADFLRLPGFTKSRDHEFLVACNITFDTAGAVWNDPVPKRIRILLSGMKINEL